MKLYCALHERFHRFHQHKLQQPPANGGSGAQHLCEDNMVTSDRQLRRSPIEVVKLSMNVVAPV